MATIETQKVITESNCCQYTPSARLPSETVLATLTEDQRALLRILVSDQAEFIDHPDFRNKGVERQLFGGQEPRIMAIPAGQTTSKNGDANRSAVPTLSIEQERLLFQQFNYARMRVMRALQRCENKALSVAAAKEMVQWGGLALEARSAIVQVNVPLVLAMAKRTRLNNIDFNELISEGNMALLRSVDKFDCSRGYKFSTYSCRAILKSFSRVAMRAARYRGLFPTEFDPSLEKSDFVDRKRADQDESYLENLKAVLMQNLAQLTDVEQRVIEERFAINPLDGTFSTRPKTLEQVGEIIGVTKERVRQIQNKAFEKLRLTLQDEVAA